MQILWVSQLLDSKVKSPVSPLLSVLDLASVGALMVFSEAIERDVTARENKHSSCYNSSFVRTI